MKELGISYKKKSKASKAKTIVNKINTDSAIK